MKIVLATIHSREALFTPLALMYLKAYLVERQGIPAPEIPLLEFRPKQPNSQIVEEILAVEPDVVGLSCYIWNIRKFREIFRVLKERRPGIKIVLGGPEVGPVAARVLEENHSVDVIVKGEGERVFAELVETFRQGAPLEQVRGIAFREGSRVRSNPEAPVFSDLNTLPSPHKPEYGITGDREICIETQRGCVFRCSFCFYNKDYSIRNRRFDLDRVKQELLYWMKSGARNIYLMDPIFNLNAERAKEICRFIIAHNSTKIIFHTEIWAEFVDQELAKLFEQANFRFLEVGLQTAEENVLSNVERRFRKEAFIKGLQYLNSMGLNVELQLIFGLPGETMESFRRSFDFAVSLRPAKIAVFPLLILPGTELWRRKEKFGLQHDPEPYYEIQRTPDLSESDVDYGKRLSRSVPIHYNQAGILLAETAVIPFSALLDQWLLWERQNVIHPKGACRVEAFIQDFCRERKNLNPDFFLALHRRIAHPQAPKAPRPSLPGRNEDRCAWG
jgi:radical SAM superfamily enzyme YgiQ (UPF0313 family)